MTLHADRLRSQLAQGPVAARVLLAALGISQPTFSRTLAILDAEIVRLGRARAIHYARRDARRGLPDIPVYRVGGDGDGTVCLLGTLVPVWPDGFVLQQTDGLSLHSEGLPWWLLDMRPQGFLGRAWAERHATALGLPSNLSEWSDVDALRCLLVHGHDAVGNLLLGDAVRTRHLQSPPPTPIPLSEQPAAFARRALDASRGDLPGSAAGGEQPKFTAYADTPDGPRHLLVKFTLPDTHLHIHPNPVTERWRDLLLAEHHAQETLTAAGIPAARSWLLDHAGQRFLAVERFDRVGALGRRGLFSLAAVEAEFVGNAVAPWPVLVKTLADAGHITRDAAQTATVLHAFGTLIGNTDMHHGNLSFTSTEGRPYTLSPAYDMLPMGFAPRSGGGLPDQLPQPTLRPEVAPAVWRQALVLARDFLRRMETEPRCSTGFHGALAGLHTHLDTAAAQIARLG